MGAAYALLVGINAYEPPVAPLRGCHEDVERALEFLRARLTSELREEVLLDGDASRQAVIDAFRQHLGAAGEDDIALFWFSGHGSEQLVADEFRHLEPTGFNQTLVCADSRRGGVPDLADKELSLLADQVAAGAGHLAVVLDCCNSGGGTREPNVSYRGADRDETAPPAEAYLPELQELARPRDAVAGPAGDRDGDLPLTSTAREPHVALSACRSFEKAKEQRLDGQIRGVFSASLLWALERLGAGATYRDVLSAARCKVENVASEQAPVLYPADLGGIADRAFLGGAVTRPAAGFAMRKLHGSWEVDAGRCHGIVPASGDDAVLFEAVPGEGDASGPARVTDVHPERSLVEPLGWEPDAERVYPVVVASVPLPPAMVVLGGLPEDDAQALELVRTALATAAPGGRPSPHVRVVAEDHDERGLRLRVAAVTGGEGSPVFRILRGDGSPATADVADHTEASARVVAARLEHIAQWSHIKELDNPATKLAGAVAIEVLAAEPGETVVAFDRAPLAPDAHGEIRLEYRRTSSAWEPPSIFLRINNRSQRQLWCVLLDLTDRFRVHPALFPGGHVGPGQVGAALEGAPLPVTLPPGREPRPGASGRDWFKLIVADREFSSLAFELPRLDEPASRSAAAMRPRSVVDRLGLIATTRDAGGDTGLGATGGDWATSIVPLVAEVPKRVH
jgi:Caspase domain